MTMAPDTILRTRTASLRLRPDGILEVQVDEGADVKLPDADASIDAERQLAGDRKRPILVNMSRVNSVSREARGRLSDPAAHSFLLATALVIGSPVSKVIGNFFLGFNKTPTPTKLFTSEAEALEWLKTFLT